MTRGRHRGVCPLTSRQPRTAVTVEERRESILAAKGAACGSRGFLAGGMEERKVYWPVKSSDNKLGTRGREILAVSDT